MLGNHLIKSWSSNQSIIALSSGEAELYAITKAACQTIGLMALARDFGDDLSGEIKCDANATLGIIHRKGLGKLRHVNVQYLWIQEQLANKTLTANKVLGSDNPADLMTKHVSRELLESHLAKMFLQDIIRQSNRCT